MRKLFTLCLLLVLVAVGAFASGSQQTSGESLVYATTEKITDMDPANAYDFHTWEIYQNVAGGLLKYKPGTTELEPGLAESYTVNDAGDVYTFKLRQGVKFSDGTPFNAQAVKWSIERVMRIAGDPSWLVTDFVDSVEAPDANTVVFKLKGPVGFFPSLVASVPYFPMNPEIYPPDTIVKDPTELKGGAFAGLGAYKITSFKRDEEVILDANPNYYGQAPKIPRIVIRYFADATTMRLALENKEVDLVYKSLNPSDIKDLMANDAYTTFQVPGAQIRYLCFETSEGTFSNNITRQAVAALIGRQEIIDKVFLGLNAPLYSMVPKGMIYHTDDFKEALGDNNVQLADKLLRQAGYSESNPLSFELWYTPSHYGDTEVNMAEVAKAQMERSKLVKVSLKSAEWATYVEKWNTKEMKAFFLGWYPDYIDPDNYTAAFAGTSGSAGMGIFFSNAQWDALFKKEQTSADPKVREQVFKELQQRWTKQVPTVPIFQGNLFVFTQPGVKGVTIGPTMIFNYNTLYFEK